MTFLTTNNNNLFIRDNDYIPEHNVTPTKIDAMAAVKPLPSLKYFKNST